MAKTISTILGIVFLLVGLLGFAAPNLMGMHLSASHNIIHLVSGALALYFGLKGTWESARTFCLVFGIVYALLGLAGFLFGGADRMLNIIPNQLVLMTADHVVHIILGALFIIGGLSRPVMAHDPSPTRS
ncbi:MAG: hypothetical protein JWM16_2613 [Verrucomicrobiales bacterium]|jgi:uncharacterized membrane protein HdeD (DUF308 family)|nr:hypothetical protein [Verrucomicrobiales bacterium]